MLLQASLDGRETEEGEQFHGATNQANESANDIQETKHFTAVSCL